MFYCIYVYIHIYLSGYFFQDFQLIPHTSSYVIPLQIKENVKLLFTLIILQRKKDRVILTIPSHYEFRKKAFNKSVTAEYSKVFKDPYNVETSNDKACQK